VTRSSLLVRPAWVVLSGLVLLGLAGCTRGRRHFNEGQTAMKQGRHAEAVVAFERAIAENGEFGEAHYNLGACRFELAAGRLRQVIAKHGTAALRRLVPPPGARPRPGQKPPADVPSLRRDLGALPPGETAPVVQLIRASVMAKSRALQLFRAGSFFVVKEAAERRQMLAQLEQVVTLWDVVLREGARDRALVLMAIFWPEALRDLLLWPGAPAKFSP
jgi:hypothetical protein